MITQLDEEESFQIINDDGEMGGLKMSLRERPKKPINKPAPIPSRRKFTDDLKFLGDFDPEKSTRERRKLTRKTCMPLPVQRNTLYDEWGRFRDNNFNLCDCLDEKCPGCFYPCPLCGCPKCGPTCRANRKFTYESIEFDGKDAVFRNKFANKS